MQVGFRDLTLWSFLMASAHGAGFMVLPFVMPTAATVAAADHDHAHHVGAAAANGAAAVAACCALRIFDAATICIALVICEVFFTDLMRRRISRVFAAMTA